MAPAARTRVALQAYYFLSFAALGAYLPLFPTWLAARGLSGTSIGLVSALLPAMSVLAPPWIGAASDALQSRGALLRVACLGASLSMAALAIVVHAGAASLLAIAACVAPYALFRSPVVMLADVVAVENARAAGTAYGKLRRWGSVGFLTAALVCGRLHEGASSLALPLGVAALLFLTFLAARCLPMGARGGDARPSSARGGSGRRFATPRFVVFLGVVLLGQLAHVAYDLCFTLHVTALGGGTEDAGVAWAMGVAAEVFVMGRADRILARIAAPRLLGLALLGAAARWALIATVPSVATLIALAPLHAVSFGLSWIASIQLVGALAPPDELATAQGAFTAATGAGSVLGMLAWGAIYTQTGTVAVFASATGVSLAAAMVTFAWARSFDARVTAASP